jgi:tetratricopeptide (TPR) repeat protein
VLIWIGFLIVLAAAAYGAYWLVRNPDKGPVPVDSSKRTPDMAAVVAANNRGVARMEQFDYPAAQTAFEEVVRLAPDWTPGQVNLGIALLNRSGLDRKFQPLARAQFERVLKQDPGNLWAHFCMGILIHHEGNPEQTEMGAAHFETVTKADPQDAAAWYWLGLMRPPGSEQALTCFRRANQLAPKLAPVIYQLALALRQTDPAAAERAFAEYQVLHDDRMDDDTQGNMIGTNYTEMGRHGDVIGSSVKAAAAPVGPMPLFQRDERAAVRLAPGARWASAADLGAGIEGELRRRVRARFGGTMVVLDYNRDGKPDLFLLGAVIDKDGVRDLLLRNDGGGKFTDVTAEAELGGARRTLGCAVADFDNDGFPDLCITGIGRQWLFRNTGRGTFEDASVQAGLERVGGVCLGACFVDLDRDGDLDLVLARYADKPERALANLDADAPKGGGLVVLVNTGIAPLAKQEGRLADVRFRTAYEQAPLVPAGFVPAAALAATAASEAAARSGLSVGDAAVVGVAAADFDLDHDLDLLVIADQVPGWILWDDRLLRFHRGSLPESLLPAGRRNGALILDSRRRGRPDALVLDATRPPTLLLSQPGAGRDDASKWFERGVTNSPPLMQAQAIDLDLDGWTDVVGLSRERVPVLLHNDGTRLVHASEALGAERDWPSDLLALRVADYDGDGFPDLIMWSEQAGLKLHRNRGNNNHSLRLELTGIRGVVGKGRKVRSNADAIGTRVSAQAGEFASGLEFTNLTAGLGQCRPALQLGLGSHPIADFVRLVWPDGVMQAELNLAAGQTHRIAETNRKDISCPILFTWNGKRFEFISDFLGAGSVGEPQPGGGHRPPRPEESVKIEPSQLAPRDGRYEIKIAEPMDEVTYLDRLQLIAIDHPSDITVYPDERFVEDGPPPSQDLLAFRERIFPVRALDQRGQDVTDVLGQWDRVMVDDFATRTWLGFAEEHWVELDFGARLAKVGPNDPIYLCLAGWTDYPYPESIWAASQAGLSPEGPVLERLGADGNWHPLAAIGFPAGLPRMITVDLTGKLVGPHCRVRLRTNMEIYWDQIFVAPLVERVPRTSRTAKILRVHELDPAADLSPRPCMKEFSPDGRQPTLYDYDLLDSIPVARLPGRLTRFGDVTELLRDVDDRFVIFGPGDEITVHFDTAGLPPVPAGWTRSFVLRTWGYCKDSNPFSDAGDAVEPLPFRAMSNYPYAPGEEFPRDRLHEEYRRRYNTREVGARSPSALRAHAKK